MGVFTPALYEAEVGYIDKTYGKANVPAVASRES
jgi:hypothetical protein